MVSLVTMIVIIVIIIIGIGVDIDVGIILVVVIACVFSSLRSGRSWSDLWRRWRWVILYDDIVSVIFDEVRETTSGCHLKLCKNINY